MGLVLTWVGALGVLISLSAIALGALVYWTRPDREQNRRLALMLALDGFVFLAGSGLIYLTDARAGAWSWIAVAVVFDLAAPFAYLLFLATLDTPWTRPLGHPAVERGLLAGMVLAPLLWFLAPDAFLSAVVPGVYTPFVGLVGPALLALWTGVMATSIYGLVAAVSLWRRTGEGTMRRSQARSYAIAFGVRDAGWALWVAGVILAGGLSGGLTGSRARFLATAIVPASILFVFVVLLAYGILKTQLFDIDLKIKWTLEKSTIAAIFGFVFVAVSEGIELLLGVEGTLYGVVAAVGIGVVFQQVERGAEALADRVMPGVEDTPEYRRERKVEVYRETLRDLLEDGEITERERTILERMRDEMDLADGAADRLESDVRDELGVVAS